MFLTLNFKINPTEFQIILQIISMYKHVFSRDANKKLRCHVLRPIKFRLLSNENKYEFRLG